MKQRKWESNQKLKIVLEGLSGQIEITKLCNKYQISQVLYYRWREQLLQYGHQAFESKNITKRGKRLSDENQRLKQIIGVTHHRVKKRVRMIRRKKSLSVIQRNAVVLSMIKHIKCDHPFQGYRRCWDYLYFRQGIKVNQKRIYRLMKENDLLVNQKRYRAKRKVSHPKANYPNYIWSTDMTKIRIGIWSWYYLVMVLDWFTKEIIGYHLSLQAKSGDWQVALEEAVQKRFPKGIKDSLQAIPFLVSDNR